MLKKILWVTDFSEHAHDAGIKAFECAKCSEGSLVALTVIDPEDLPMVLDVVPDPFISADAIDKVNIELTDDFEKVIKDHLSKEVKSLGSSSQKIETLIRVGIPEDEIVKVADEIGATIIVLGSHGKRSLEDLILGSTVENVTKKAHCPVLVVR